MTKLMWHGEIPSTENVLDLEDLVTEDINRNGLDNPANLIFHHIFLTDDYRGPSILVYGKEGDDQYYHCEYHLHTEWEFTEEEKLDC